MGRVKQRLLEHEALNLYRVPNKHTCVKHIKDKSISHFIRTNYTDGYCDYCEKNLKVVELQELMEFIIGKVNMFYQDAAHFMSHDSSEGGYQGYTYSPFELIKEEIGLDIESFQLDEDIINSIADIAWANPDLYYDNEKDELEYHWSYFKEFVKHRSRFLFQPKSDKELKVGKILQEVGKLLSNPSIIKKVSKGTKLYRARQHNYKTKITAFKDIVSPPKHLAIYPNRFSPSGISMFYAASNIDTAIKETISRVDKKSKYVTIAEFEILDDFYVVDLTNLPKPPSIFAVRNRKEFYIKQFLQSFVLDITQPIKKDGKEHTEYVPTQVITEYIRYPFNNNRKRKISGITYLSSQNLNHTSSVFFWDNNECIESIKLLDLQTRKW